MELLSTSGSRPLVPLPATLRLWVEGKDPEGLAAVLTWDRQELYVVIEGGGGADRKRYVC